MKKLIIAAAVICATVIAQAAAFSWSSTGGASNGKVWDYTGSGALYKSDVTYTAYLFCTADITQDALLQNVRGGKGLDDAANKAIAGANNTLNNSSKLAAQAFTYAGTAGSNYDFFFAIVDADNKQVLISDLKQGLAQESGTSALAFNANTFSKNAYGTAAFSNAGWYAAAPEPTSGLMLLLGVGLMALRRRRS